MLSCSFSWDTFLAGPQNLPRESLSQMLKWGKIALGFYQFGVNMDKKDNISRNRLDSLQYASSLSLIISFSLLLTWLMSSIVFQYSYSHVIKLISAVSGVISMLFDSIHNNFSLGFDENSGPDCQDNDSNAKPSDNEGKAS
jgi:hypothetical protein